MASEATPLQSNDYEFLSVHRLLHKEESAPSCSYHFSPRRILLLSSVLPLVGAITAIAATSCNASKTVIMLASVIGAMFTPFSCMAACLDDPAEITACSRKIKTSFLTKIQVGIGISTFAINAGFAIWSLATMPPAPPGSDPYSGGGVG